MQKNVINKPIHVLVLNEERYRSDLSILAKRDDVMLHILPSKVQNIVNAIWLSDIRNISVNDPDAFLRNENALVRKARSNLHDYLKNIIYILSSKYQIDCIVSCTFYYRQDREWESAAVEISVPFFVLHKENMKDPVTHEANIKRYIKKAYRFNGSKLFLTNQLEKEVLLKASCVSQDKIAVVGSLRMDHLYNQVRNKRNDKRRDKIILFSTHHRSGLLQIEGLEGWFNPKRDAGFIRHFTELHGNFARIALERPDREFVIKTKWLGVWRDEIHAAIKEILNVDPVSISNLIITDSIPAHDLIDAAQIVTGFNSTTLLEAKLARVPVIVPLFEEAANKYLNTNVYFQKYMSSFAVVNTPDEFCDILRKAIDGQPPNQEKIPEAMIRDYLGFFDGKVAERVVGIMRHEIYNTRNQYKQFEH